MTTPPDWLRAARDHWQWRGTARPPFATPPGPGQTSVWDFPRPPRLAPDTREVVIRWRGREVARTRRAIRVLETSHPPSFYLPWDDVARELLQPAGGGSFCEWKGPARYWDLVDEGGPGGAPGKGADDGPGDGADDGAKDGAGDGSGDGPGGDTRDRPGRPGNPARQGEARLSRFAWSYPQPLAGAEPLAGCVAFYPRDLDCRVDGAPVRPQPGGFYGGWITPELVGPFKGEPGSEGW